jgi:endoglucanase
MIRRKSCIWIMAALAFACRADGVTATERAAPRGSPLAINGQLQVCGTKLCNEHGRAIQLRGMSTHGLQWYSQCVTNPSLDILASNWRADVLRISMYVQEGGYQTNPRQFTDRVHAIIEQATARGLYVIVDWHMLDPGDPFFNLAGAKTFFGEIARLHRRKTNILYEVANEPNGVSWARIRSYHRRIIPVIRKWHPSAIVLLGTRGWSSLGVSDGADEIEVINNPVNAANIMYTFHFYAASHRGAYLQALSRAARQIPMFVTELGTQRYTGGGANDFANAQRYIDLMARKQISWANWNYSDDRLSGAVFKPGTCNKGTFGDGTSLKPAGRWIRRQIRSPDNFP